MPCKCQRCDEPATRFHGRPTRDHPHSIRMCDLHFKIRGMIGNSKTRGVTVPTVPQLLALFADLKRDGMKCPACKRQMVMHSEYADRASVVSIQHWADGSISLVCHSCNVRHGAYGDAGFIAAGTDKRHCCECDQMLPLTAFPVSKYKGDARGGKYFGGRTGRCSKCIDRTLRARFHKPKESAA